MRLNARASDELGKVHRYQGEFSTWTIPSAKALMIVVLEHPMFSGKKEC
jgi:hypothetical protein